jgi:hypothetical protein
MSYEEQIVTTTTGHGVLQAPICSGCDEPTPIIHSLISVAMSCRARQARCWTSSAAGARCPRLDELFVLAARDPTVPRVDVGEHKALAGPRTISDGSVSGTGCTLEPM